MAWASGVPIQPVEGGRARPAENWGWPQETTREPQHISFLARRLTPANRVQIGVRRAGVATPASVPAASTALATVLEPFTASASCRRENAQTGCLPIRPIGGSSSAPCRASSRVGACGRRQRGERADQMRQGTETDALIGRLQFPAARAARTLRLPPDLKMTFAANAAGSFPLHEIATGPMLRR